MIRKFSTVGALSLCALLLTACDSSSGGAGDKPAVREVKAGSGQRPGSDLSAQAMNQDPTGTDAKTKKAGEKPGEKPAEPKPK